MKQLLRFVRLTLLGGLLFLVPLAVVVILIEKVFVIVKRLHAPFFTRFGSTTFIGITIHEILIILLLLLVCFGAGLFTKSTVGVRFIRWFEHNVLNYFPGYLFIKSIAGAVAGFEEKDLTVLLVRIDDGWQFSFLIEKINDNLYTVFVPDAPRPWSGGVYHVEPERIIWTTLTKRQAIHCLRQMGAGSAALLKEQFESREKGNKDATASSSGGEVQ